MTHTLKTIQPYYNQVVDGSKTFELRKMDRPFNVGDKLILQEYDGVNLTGAEIQMKIKYILKDCPQFGLMDGYCILGLEDDINY